MLEIWMGGEGANTLDGYMVAEDASSSYVIFRRRAL